MADLFSAEWMTKYQEEWNGEAELAGELEKISFNSIIGYGFVGEDAPAGFIKVENGKVSDAGAYNGEELSWDMRAAADNWQKWMDKGIGMMGLGAAATTGKLKFETGDYKAMVKDPRMAKPFIKSFSVMGRV